MALSQEFSNKKTALFPGRFLKTKTKTYMKK